MANERNSRSTRSSAGKRPARRPTKKPKQKQKRVRRSLVSEFKPDAPLVSPLKGMRFTHLQWLQILRWLSYIGICVLCLVIQDSIMSRVSIFGATTDLAVAAMLLITVLEGSEVGSVFILIASTVFYFSGSAPGPYSVGLLTILGLGASLFRQMVWHRSRGSIVLCAGLAAIIYEIGLYFTGLFMGLTSWYRLPRFLITGLLTAAAMFPLYYVIYRIGQIGGHTWKE
ncbi:MAG: hypothetical protein SO355_06840 [Candidatus Faecousia sp.]|nr:hypothetical protein [Bacillota bacterium]MDY4755040.1 hypothetical protein [Candidatus Faecousia sp.]MDY6160828.1 hypothetical protein [Candidatus Faecousia sp.]